MITKIITSVIAIVLLFVSVGCFGRGVRKLSAAEMQYFAALKAELQRSDDDLKKIRHTTRVNDETALREIARLDDAIRTSKVVYSVREVLGAPTNDRATFVQVTRNKVILYHLAETAKANQERVAVELAAAAERRRQLQLMENDLVQTVNAVIESGTTVHNHLSKGTTANVQDLLSEVGRQVSAFNQALKTAEQSNPVIMQLAERGASAEARVDRAEADITRLVDLWSRLNQKD